MRPPRASPALRRDQEHNVRRGVADANFLLAHGVAQPLAAFKNGRQTIRWSLPELLRP